MINKKIITKRIPRTLPIKLYAKLSSSEPDEKASGFAAMWNKLLPTIAAFTFAIAAAYVGVNEFSQQLEGEKSNIEKRLKDLDDIHNRVRNESNSLIKDIQDINIFLALAKPNIENARELKKKSEELIGQANENMNTANIKNKEAINALTDSTKKMKVLLNDANETRHQSVTILEDLKSIQGEYEKASSTAKAEMIAATKTRKNAETILGNLKTTAQEYKTAAQTAKIEMDAATKARKNAETILGNLKTTAQEYKTAAQTAKIEMDAAAIASKKAKTSVQNLSNLEKRFEKIVKEAEATTSQKPQKPGVNQSSPLKDKSTGRKPPASPADKQRGQ